MTDPIIDRLDAIRGRADKATEGPWEASLRNPADPLDATIIDAEACNGMWVASSDDDEREYENAEFIAHARTDVPALVDALIRVLERCERAIASPAPDGEMRQAYIAMRETAEIIRDEIASALGVETEGEEK